MTEEELFRVRGKISVILGGNSGIGKAVALGYARAGAHVVVSSRRASLAEANAAEIRSLVVKALAVACDVRSYGSVAALLDAVLAEFSRVDVLVVSSGVNSKTPTVELSEQEFIRIIDT